MNLLSVENISKAYGERVLFKNLSFGILKGEKKALIAKNGTGKTSLLRIIAGLEPPDAGKVTFRTDLKVAFLPQEPEIDPNKTIIEQVLSANDPLTNCLRNYEMALATQNNQSLQEALSQMEMLNAWDAESKIKQVLGSLNLHDVTQKTANLSGGQKKRIALAACLLSNPELIIMDEPTNHLDLDMVEWLEEYLSQASISVFMVTHDRYFLENVCSEILELDQLQLFSYTGNYAYYLEKKAERQDQTATEIEKAKNLYKTELEWVRRMPQARTTKSKARLDAFNDLKVKATKRIDNKQVDINFGMQRLGAKVVELHKLSKSYGPKKLFVDFNYKFQQGEKVGLAGKNGAGKSTLIKIILGKEKPDTGKIVIGDTVDFGYYSQDGMLLKEDLRVMEVLQEITEVVKLKDGKVIQASQLLERFLFNRKQHYQYVSTLSGGEKRRLYLLTILMKNPNFLILDEPTNDLDILTLNILEDYLLEYPGCVLLVTHDRFLLDKVAEHVLIFEGNNKIVDFVGKFSDYRTLQKASQLQKAKTEKNHLKTQMPDTPKQIKNKVTFNEKREFEQLDNEIPILEAEKELLTNKLSSGTLSNTEIVDASNRITHLIEQLETKSNRWLELAEKIDLQG